MKSNTKFMFQFTKPRPIFGMILSLASLILPFITIAQSAPKTDAKALKIQRILDAANAKNEFSGAALVSIGDKIVYQGAVGMANRAWQIPNRTTTKFRINSVTKQFTAMLVMQLIEAGKLKLDGVVSDYLPDFRRETGAKISLANLLQSASGLPDLPPAFYVDEAATGSDATSIIKTYLGGDLQFAPGERFNYNNADFIVLGAIIERVTGKPFETVLRERILMPLGMKSTGLLKNETVVPNLASGYSVKDGVLVNESFVQIQNFGAAGAMFSTLEDLKKWDDALLSFKLLSKSATETMFKPNPKLGFVALGSWSYNLKLPDKTHRFVERQGAINGFSTLNIIAPEDKISLILLGNLETQTLFQTYAAKELSYEILAALTETEPAMKVAARPRRDFRRCECSLNWTVSRPV